MDSLEQQYSVDAAATELGGATLSSSIQTVKKSAMKKQVHKTYDKVQKDGVPTTTTTVDFVFDPMFEVVAGD